VKIDGRTLSHETSETIRRMAVKRVHDGETPSSVMKSYGLCRTTIYRWLRAEKRGGEAALQSHRATGRPPLLSESQKRKVCRWIVGKDPRQHGFDFGLWTRRIVVELVEKKFEKQISVTAVGRLLYELDITPQKPLRRAYERDPVAVAKWTEEDYPKLKARAKRCGADIFFLDETGVRSDSALQRTWGARGKTPTVETSGQRQRVNAISAVNASGAFWYDVYTGNFNATLFIEKLKAFMRHRRRGVFLVLDGHPAHRAKIVAEYVQSLKGQLELHFLPGYAPDLNPDEFVWNHLRQNGVTKKPLMQNEQLKARVEEDLECIKRSPRLVRSFFRAKSVAYVLD
jgi:transposase